MQGLALPKGNCVARCSRHNYGRARILTCPGAAVLDSPVAAKAAEPVVLPPSLKNTVVVLDAPNPDAPGGVTKVYLLAMSHVSKKSVEQVRELVRAVQPDVVGVELCKDRVPLLVDDSSDTISNLLWHSRKVIVEGLPSGPEWPTWEQLSPLLRSRIGRPLTKEDIEADITTLLATGLFRTARPMCANGTLQDSPSFVEPTAEGTTADSPLQCVPPLSTIKFVVAERSLPPLITLTVRVDSSLKAAGVPQEQLDDVCSQALMANSPKHEGGPVASLTCLLRARAAFQELYKAHGCPGVVVTFTGVDNGRVEAIVKAERAGSSFVTGFESSAVNGDGWGIEPFRPAKKLTKLSNKMYLTDETVAALRGKHLASAADKSEERTSHSKAPPATQYKEWTGEEIDGCKQLTYEGNDVTDFVGLLLTGLFAKHQTAAARKLGLTPGAAWQAAMSAAHEVGAQQVALIDRPVRITERKLSDALMAHAGARLGGALGLVLSSLVAFLATNNLPETTEAAAFMGVLAVASAIAWPLWAPITQISKLASMTPEEIEEAVAITQPISQGDLSQPLKLFGEDALLEWPGAMQPVIRDRDTFMAKALAGLATGSAAVCPAYVRDIVGGQLVWRFMMPENAPPATAPVGLGDGAFKPLKGARSVVGIVGSAHVHGMIREWSECVKAPGDVSKQLEC